MHAVGLQLKADESGTVRSLLAGCGGRTIEIEAKVFVIAAGGLETPRLLLNSGRAFGAGAALTGRFLMDHPVGYFSQAVFRKKLNVAFGGSTLTGRTGYLTGLSIRAELQKEYRLPNHYVFVRPGTGPAKIPNDLLRSFLGVRGVLDLSARHMMTILKSRYILQRVVCERFGVSVKTRFGDIYVMAEQLPNPDSRVDLSTDQVDGYGYPIARVNWRLSHDEWQSFGSFISLVAAGLRGDERIASLRLDDIAEWPQVLSSAAHHLGTARMAATPRQGVVDADLRVFGCRNLFVCDGSVFPTASGTNPSFTICALGLRLGEHLVRLFISAGGRGSDHAVWGAALATITRRPVA
jgi:choline dehydrogenase-like flavoprotein